MSNYVVTVRGPVPPDLGRKVAEAHALAIQRQLTTAVNMLAGKKVKPSMGTIRRDL